MFIAMNRFQVISGREEDFEAVWRARQSHLEDVPGFKAFHLLRAGAGKDGTTLFVSHSQWASRSAFEAWTRSEAFRAAHRHAGSTGDLYAGPPVLELLEAVEGVG